MGVETIHFSHNVIVNHDSPHSLVTKQTVFCQTLMLISCIIYRSGRLSNTGFQQTIEFYNYRVVQHKSTFVTCQTLDSSHELRSLK